MKINKKNVLYVGGLLLVGLVSMRIGAEDAAKAARYFGMTSTNEDGKDIWLRVPPLYPLQR